jgi:tetratricopeptide (TPR) repeat protein
VKATEEYKAAIREDENFAPAHAGLAWVSAMQSGFKPPREAFPEAKKYAQSAIKLNNKLAPAHAALAFVHFYYDWDWKRAEDEFKTAIELDPSYASAHSNYAILLAVRNRFPEALRQARAAEQADPVSAAVGTGLGRVFYWSGQYREALEQFQRVFSMHPQFSEARLSMATAQYASHNPDAAVRQMSYVLSDSLNSGAIADLAYIYAGIGEKELARDMLLRLESLRNENKRYISPCHLAIAYAALGEQDEAFTLLNEGLKERTFEMVYLGINPEYEPLRQDARWRGLVREVGLAR